MSQERQQLCVHKEESSEGSADVSSVAGQLTAAGRCSPAWYARRSAPHVPPGKKQYLAGRVRGAASHVQAESDSSPFTKQSRMDRFTRPIIQAGGN